MTTIAYRAGVMAADSRGYSGNRTPVGSKAKIERLEDGTLIGASCTIAGGAEAIRKWYCDGMPKEPAYALPEAFTLLIVKPNGEALYGNDAHMLAGPLTADFYAIGSGCDYALGAMEMGADAKTAVEVACKLDVWSDCPIYCVSHDGDLMKV